jgi:3-oxoacyl-[acyl-carrier protein] reductase
MTDYLLELSKSQMAKDVIKGLGLPVPMPQPLERETRPREVEPLTGRTIAFHASPESSLLHSVTEVLLTLGAELGVPSNVAEVEEIAETAEGASGELVELALDASEPQRGFDGLVLDATTASSPEELDRLYEFFHPRLRSMERCGRVVILGRPPSDAEDPAQAAAWRGLDGFTRSLAKELGRFGSTANLLNVERAAEERLSGPLGFLLSDRSAYVSAQPIDVQAGGGIHPDRARSSPMLDGSTAVVTGAAGGIGRAITDQLTQEGADVIGVDLPQHGRLQKLETEFGARPFPLDITADDAPDRLATAAEEHDGVDILIHNAGITRDRTLVNLGRKAWRNTLEVNVEAPLRLTDRLLDEDLIDDWGRIVCMSSVSGVAGNVGQTNYATSKAGLIGAVGRYAEQLADRGITVNALAPGFIETRMTEEMPTVVREVARRMNALSQGGDPVDMANAAAFLATPGAQGVTGSVLRVCGAALVGA